jgi:hypothetical protein
MPEYLSCSKRKLKFPESIKYLPKDFPHAYVSFIIQKNLIRFQLDDSVIEEITIDYRLKDSICRKYVIYSNNSGYVYFDTKGQRVNYSNYKCIASWLMLPFQSLKLGSLVLYECISYRDRYCPSLALSQLALSDDSDEPENELKRNKLYINFGYEIKDFKAYHTQLIKSPVDKLYGYELHSLRNYPGDIFTHLDDLYNYSSGLY